MTGRNKPTSDVIRGVNLGGWLVLEKWMTPSLFSNTDATDEYTLSKQDSIKTIKRITRHRNTFITRSDFLWLRKHGITAVRLPFGYWVFGDEPPYLPTISYIDKAFEWAEETGIKILLDMHGAPGSQNGQDHSGQSGACKWHKNDRNVIKTLEVMNKMIEQFGNHPNLLGFELLNEPKASIPRRKLSPYYKTAYKLIREQCPETVWIVFSDGFRPTRWKRTMRSSKFLNVLIDSHQYQNYTRKDTRLDIAGHLKKTLESIPHEIRKMQKYHPTIVGEWSLALDDLSLNGLSTKQKNDAYTAYGASQSLAYAQASAWFYWSYRTEMGGVWSFRDCVANGWINHQL